METSKSSEASKPQKRLKAREGFIILFPSKENVLKIIILKKKWMAFFVLTALAFDSLDL